jgi:hypothetical protein
MSKDESNTALAWPAAPDTARLDPADATPKFPAPLTVWMLLVAAILAKSGYPFLAIGGVAGLQAVYLTAAYSVSRGLGLFRRTLPGARGILDNAREAGPLILASGRSRWLPGVSSSGRLTPHARLVSNPKFSSTRM